jgi:hypothetical protein
VEATGQCGPVTGQIERVVGEEKEAEYGPSLPYDRERAPYYPAQIESPRRSPF